MRLFRSLSPSASSVRLESGKTLLRSPVERDWRAYAEIRAASRKFLEPWEPTWPNDALSRDAFYRRLNRYASDWRNDTGYSMFLFDRESSALVGGISLSNVRRGVAQCGTLGYWMGEAYAGKGYMSEGCGFCWISALKSCPSTGLKPLVCRTTSRADACFWAAVSRKTDMRANT